MMSFSDGRDLPAHRGVMGTLVYSLAPGPNLFRGLNELRAGDNFKNFGADPRHDPDLPSRTDAADQLEKTES